ncbi:MAG TPA: tetratricopeptide repeat protein [Bdellovibrionota bacterium]|nr:tetratricopeptide repeat protein [Bdellovibrionota bacterium]
MPQIRTSWTRLLSVRDGGRVAALVVLVLMTIPGSGCSVNNAKKSYVLAEKLWNDGKYAASVAEFDKIFSKDPQGPLGQQALFRAATTQAFFLSQYGEAVRKLKIYVEQNRDKPTAWSVQQLIGELLFSKLEQYDLASLHYQQLVKENPKAAEVPEFLFRIGKSEFYAAQFDEAIKSYRALIKAHPSSPWSEKAAYEIGVTYFTRGEQHPGGSGPGMEAYQEAIDSYQGFLNKFPKSELVPQAQFGIASCLEELDQLDAAYHSYEALKSTYPSPKVIEIKLARIRERKNQRSR